MGCWTARYQEFIRKDTSHIAIVDYILRNLENDNDKATIEYLQHFLRVGEILASNILKENNRALEHLQELGVLRLRDNKYEFTSNILDILSNTYYPRYQLGGLQQALHIGGAEDFIRLVFQCFKYVHHMPPTQAHLLNSKYKVKYLHCCVQLSHPDYKVFHETRTLANSKKCDIWVSSNREYGLEFKVGCPTPVLNWVQQTRL